MPPSVQDRPSALGLSVLDPPAGLVAWEDGSMPAVRAARERFDAKDGKLRAGQTPGGACSLGQ